MSVVRTPQALMLDIESCDRCAGCPGCGLNRQGHGRVVVQVIDDTIGHTLVSASDIEADIAVAGGTKTERARKVGAAVAERAKAAGISAVVFDRGGNKYFGRVAAVAEAAREGGLEL